MRIGWRRGLAVLALAAMPLPGMLWPQAVRADEAPVVVLAAASLKNALDDAVAAYAQAGGGKVVTSYAASSALAKQIENGAGADLFISADEDWMNEVAARGLIDRASRRNLLGNALVLIAPAAAHSATRDIGRGLALRRLLGDGRLAMADPDAVPAGKYGKAALEKLGLWDQVKDRIASAENVRGALLFVDRGETPYGIVYATDAVADPKVAIVGTFPADSHPPIIYPIARLAASKGPAAAKFLRFLDGPAARSAFAKQGFRLLQ